MSVRTLSPLIIGFATVLMPASGIQAGTVDEAPGTITLYRDRMGVPHIYGRTPAEAFFGAGYSLGQDRLSQSELARRGAQGRLAEILGPSALPADRTARTYALRPREVAAMLAGMTAEHRGMVEALVAGLNQAIDEANADPARKLPYEFGKWGVRPSRWTVADYVETIGANWRNYGSSGGKELTNLDFYHDMVSRYGEVKAKLIFDDVLPLDDPDAVPVLSPRDFTFRWPKLGDPEKVAGALAPVSRAALSQVKALRDGAVLCENLLGMKQSASRAFVVSGKRSRSGRAMMLEATSENPDVHFVGGDLDAVGFTTPPGSPPLMGRSPTIGWLSTTGESDVVDIFAERLNPADRYQYRYNDAWRPMERRTEVIKVRGAPDETIEIATTIHGPVVAWDVANGVAYSEKNALAGYEMVNWGARVEIARAKTLEQFERAVRMVPTSTNIVYAGIDGRIGFWHAGRLPIRAPGVDPRLPTPGTGNYEWRGVVPVHQLPHKIDPEAGFLHVWNNKPAAGLTYGDSSRYGKTFRTWMGVALGAEKPKLDMDDMRRINRLLGLSAGAYDLSVANPRLFTPLLAKAAAMGPDPRLRQAVSLMAAWNGAFEDRNGDGRYDSPGAALFRAWLPIAQKAIIGNTIGDWWHNIDDAKYVKYRTDVLLRAMEGQEAGKPMRYDWFDGRDRVTVLRQTLVDTLAELERDFGSRDPAAWRLPIYWRYYDTSKIGADPSKPSFPGDSGENSELGVLGQVLAAIPHNLSEEWNVLMDIGQAPGQYIESSTPIGGQSQFIAANGKAGPHTSDQLMLHAAFAFKRVSLDRATIAREAESVTVLRMPNR